MNKAHPQFSFLASLEAIFYSLSNCIQSLLQTFSLVFRKKLNIVFKYRKIHDAWEKSPARAQIGSQTWPSSDAKGKYYFINIQSIQAACRHFSMSFSQMINLFLVVFTIFEYENYTDNNRKYSVIFIMRPRVRACKLGIFRSFSLVFVLIPQ